jgi:ATP-dependent DNA helicase RecG
VTINDPSALLRRLLREPGEAEWLEFKHNNCDPDEIGRCTSACANASMLSGIDRAFIVFGIENGTKRQLGTNVKLESLKKGAEGFRNWLTRQLTPRLLIEFVDFDYRAKHFSIISIEPSYDRPVAFSGEEYIRIGEHIKRLKEFPEYEKALWLATTRHKFEAAIAMSHQSQTAVLELLDTDRYYVLSEEEKPHGADEVMKRFVTRGFIKDDMEGGYDITNLGAVLFARDLRNFASVAGKSVRVIRYTARDKRASDLEQEGQ